MGKTALQAINRAKLDIAKTVARSIRAVTLGIGKKSKEECEAAFSMNQKEAPLWAHAAVKLSGQHLITQGKNGGGGAPASLAVVVVNPVQSVAEWQQQADAFRTGKVI